MTPTAPPREKVTSDTEIKVNVQRSLKIEAGTVLTYGCPGDPAQCTVALGTITAVAAARLAVAPTGSINLSLDVRVTASQGTSQNITVGVTAGSNISVPNATYTVPPLGVNGSQTVAIPISFTGVVGSTGRLTVYIAYNGESKNMPEMELTVAV